MLLGLFIHIVATQNRFLYVLVGCCTVQAAIGCHKVSWLFQSVNQPANGPYLHWPSLLLCDPLKVHKEMLTCHHSVPVFRVGFCKWTAVLLMSYSALSSTISFWSCMRFFFIASPELPVSSSAALVEPSAITWTTQTKSLSNPLLPPIQSLYFSHLIHFVFLTWYLWMCPTD